jgi:hypothetical protein
MSEGEEVIYLDVSYEATFFITSMGASHARNPCSIPAAALSLVYAD